MMKRVISTVASLGLFLMIGCARDYDTRLASTIDNRRYQKRLNDNLEVPPTKSNLQTSKIYIRPPKGLKGPTQTFGLPGVEAGRFDIEDSFIDQQKQGALHLLARVDLPKAPTKKGAAPVASTPRGDFVADVLDDLKNVYGADLDRSKLKAESKSRGRKTNTFQSLTLDLTAKQVKVYLFADKSSPEKVALIFDYPKDEYKNLGSKIDLCLESFRVGAEADRAFAGGEEELMGGEEGPAAPPGGVF
jgi:hypothetical protein